MSRLSIRFLIAILFTTFAITGKAQAKEDTLRLVLHYSENEMEADSSLQEQIDSLLSAAGFNDPDYTTRITNAVVFGHTDNTGPKKNNQLLSEQRAEAVANYLFIEYEAIPRIVMGFGETKPIADNKTMRGKLLNRRVELTIAYSQEKLIKTKEYNSKKEYKDTLVTFEDGTKLRIRQDDYNKIKDCIIYRRRTALNEIYFDLKENESNEDYYIFGGVMIRWCNTECLTDFFTLSVRVPDNLIKNHLPELKVYLVQLEKQRAKLKKHKDGKWYIDVKTKCLFDWPGCGFHCGTRGKGKKIHYKRVKVVAKDGYKIVSAQISGGAFEKYKKIKKPKRKVKFKISCPTYLPGLSIIAIKNDKTDTLYYAYGTEEDLAYKRRCFNCTDKKTVVRKILGLKIHKRLLRRKYIFRQFNYKSNFPLRAKSNK